MRGELKLLDETFAVDCSPSVIVIDRHGSIETVALPNSCGMKLERRIFRYCLMFCSPIVIAIAMYAVLAGAFNGQFADWVDSRLANGWLTWRNFGLPWSAALEVIAAIAGVGILASKCTAKESRVLPD